MSKERIALFGGTFNPIHSGHVRAAQIVRDIFSLDKILFIPAYIPPHKGLGEVADPVHRLKMVELAVKSFPHFLPSSLEIEAEGKSYSIVTLNKMKKKYPEAHVFFILGVDAFLEIKTWKDYEEVLSLCSFIVTSRPGYRLGDADKVLGKKYSQKLYSLSGKENIDEKMLAQYKIFLLSIDTLDISSTEIRKKIKEKRSISHLVPETVEVYLEKNKIYQ
jgi:nicotinate-nucleotide adenylyltransferase